MQTHRPLCKRPAGFFCAKLGWKHTGSTFRNNHQQAVWWLSNSRDVTLVESFIWFGNPVDGQVSCRAAPNKIIIFIECCSETGGWACIVSTVEGHSVSLRHRMGRTFQDHRTSWKRKLLVQTPLTSLGYVSEAILFKKISFVFCNFLILLCF